MQNQKTICQPPPSDVLPLQPTRWKKYAALVLCISLYIMATLSALLFLFGLSRLSTENPTQSNLLVYWIMMSTISIGGILFARLGKNVRNFYRGQAVPTPAAILRSSFSQILLWLLLPCLPALISLFFLWIYFASPLTRGPAAQSIVVGIFFFAWAALAA